MTLDLHVSMGVKNSQKECDQVLGDWAILKVLDNRNRIQDV